MTARFAMPPKLDPKRKPELARIHILKSELGLDRDQYEAVLWTIAQVDSSAKLDGHGRRRVIEHLQAHVDAKRGIKADADKPTNLQARPQLRKIAAQLASAGRSWAYARAISERLYNKPTIEFCDTRELSGVIAALDKDAGRNGRARR